MKKMKLLFLVLIAAGLSSCGDEKKEVKIETEVQKFSYAMGLDVGRSLKGLGAEVDADAFSKAVADTLADAQLAVSQEDATKIKQDFFRKRQEAMLAERTAASSKNKIEGEAFLVENAKKEGVKVTKSGLQYEVVTQGDGAKPKETDKVKVHYQGTLINGEEFDSSYSRGQPIIFPLNGVIKGWTEGVALMPVGSKYKFYIPSELAYGERGAGAKIGPNATLIFTIELLSIEKNESVKGSPKK